MIPVISNMVSNVESQVKYTLIEKDKEIFVQCIAPYTRQVF